MEVTSGTGELLFRLERSDKGYSVEGPSGKLASVKVQEDRVKLADPGGTPLFKVKQKEGGFKLYREPAAKGGADIELANFWSGGGELQIKDGSDRQLYDGKDKGGKYEVKGPEGRTYVLKTRDDGLEVEDSSGKRLVRIKGLSSPAAGLFCAAPEYDPLQKACVVSFTAGVAP